MKKRQATKQQVVLAKIALGAIAIVCITIIELFALYKGIDGQLMALTLAAIAGIAGYNLKTIVSEVKRQ